MIRLLISTLAFALVILAINIPPTLSAPVSLGKHHGSMSSSNGYSMELVSDRKGRRIVFTCYISDGSDSFLSSGDLTIRVTGEKGQTKEIMMTSSGNCFTGSAEIPHWGDVQIEEIYTPATGVAAVASVRQAM